MDLLGSAADAEGAQLFLLTDLDRARGWGGVKSPAFGDAARAFEDGDAAARSVGGVDLVGFGGGGWNLVYRDGDRLILVDGAFDEVREGTSTAGDDEDVPTSAAFVAWASGPTTSEPSLVVDVPSGWLCAMSATAVWALLGGDDPLTVESLAASGKGVVQIDDADGGHALFVRATAKRYAVHVEPEIEADWGVAARVVLTPRA